MRELFIRRPAPVRQNSADRASASSVRVGGLSVGLAREWLGAALYAVLRRGDESDRDRVGEVLRDEPLFADALEAERGGLQYRLRSILEEFAIEPSRAPETEGRCYDKHHAVDWFDFCHFGDDLPVVRVNYLHLRFLPHDFFDVAGRSSRYLRSAERLQRFGRLQQHLFER